MNIFRFKIKKISYRLTVVYALLFFTALVSVNTATLVSINYYMNQTSAQQLVLIAQAVKKEIKVLNDIQRTNFTAISQMTNNVDISLVLNDAVVYETGESYNLPLPNDTNIDKTKSVEIDDNKILYINEKLVLTDKNILYVQIVKDMNSEQIYLDALITIMLVMDAVILFVAAFVGFAISKKALTPIDKIISQAKLISASDLTKRIELNGPDDELKRLSDTFNDLIARIQYSYEKQNQFTLDASHELATPLAVIKGYIDLIDRWGKDNREVLNEGIEAIKNELSNMTKLLDTLLFMSKGDNEILKIEKTKFWLNELIVEVVKESKNISESHIIYCNTNDSILIEADKRLIKQMLRAIIDNSIKYTAQNGSIEVNLKIENEHVTIIISDTGIGIAKEDLPHIFDRFYRVDKARSRQFGGSGLGLSIAKWIVDIHGGSIEVESNVGKGTKMRIRLPVY
ncbi:MAG: ATP-binding protein [Eubacteriales bacterium]